MANPREFKIRIAPQATEDLPDRIAAASWKDIRVHPGSDVSAEWSPIEDPRITGDAFASVPLRGIIENSLELTMSLNAEEAIYFFGQAAQQSANTDNGGGVYEEEFVVGVGGTTWDDFMMAEVDHGIGLPTVFYNGQVRSIQITAEENSVVTMTVGLDFGAHHQWADATLVNNQTLNSQIVGLADDTMWDQATAAERRLYFKVDDDTAWAAGAGTIDVLCKIGAAASYGARTFEVTGDTFVQVLDSNVALTSTLHNMVGDSAERVMLRIPAAGTPVDDDEWYYQLGPAVWTPSYTTSPSLGSPNAALLYAGANQSIDTFDLTWNVPSIMRHGPGNKQTTSIVKQGEHGGELTIGRLLIDDAFTRQRRARNLVEFRMDAISPASFASGYHYLVTIVAHCLFGGEDPQTDAESYADDLSGTLHAYAAHSWADAPVNAQIISSIATPEA